MYESMTCRRTCVPLAGYRDVVERLLDLALPLYGKPSYWRLATGGSGQFGRLLPRFEDSEWTAQRLM